MIGKLHVRELYASGVAKDIMNKLRASGFGGVGRLDTIRQSLVDNSGDTIPVNMTASIIYENGEEVATVGVFTDIRSQLRMEKDLNAAQAQLLQTEKARVAADLAGMAAHELNQPLTSVLGYAEMLKRRIANSDTLLSKPADVVLREAERMADIVKRIGRITKHETKEYGAQTTMMDLERASSSVSNPKVALTEAPMLEMMPSRPKSMSMPVIRPETIDAESRKRVEQRSYSGGTETVPDLSTIADDFEDPQENTKPELHVGPGSQGGTKSE